MNLALRIDNNIIAIIVAVIFYKNISNNLDKKEIKNRAFSLMFKLNTVEIVIETLTCIINRRPYSELIPVSAFLHTALYVLAPIITYCWYVFVKLWINEKENSKYKKNVWLLAPIIVNTVLALFSQFLRIEFYIDSYNVYQRGPAFFLPACISFFYFLYSFLVIYVNRKKMSRVEFVPLITFGIFPTAASLVQIIFYGFLLMWSSIAYSLIILYLYLQQQMLHVDHLTGAWSREKFYSYLTNRIQQRKHKNFAIVFIDLNDFKKINDNFGHGEGDKALINLVKIIKGELREEDIITRYGGDEFILLCNVASNREIEIILKRISQAMKEYNEKTRMPYNLNFSYGYELYNFDTHMTPDEFINHVDKLMYLNKQHKVSTLQDN